MPTFVDMFAGSGSIGIEALSRGAERAVFVDQSPISVEHINQNLKNTGLLIKAFIGSGFITAIELVFGIIFNVILKKNVWDYSKLPLNLGGQICALYSFIWLIISAFFIPLAGFMNKKLLK